MADTPEDDAGATENIPVVQLDNGVAYSLHYAVGPSCRNCKMDVMLVQFLLRRYFGMMCPRGPGISEDMYNLQIDGLMGPKTAKAIALFQKFHPMECPVMDGRVDPGKYTMGALDSEYKKSNPEYAQMPWYDPWCPKDLAEYLQHGKAKTTETTEVSRVDDSDSGQAGGDW